jgi:hypothetical protein
VGHSVVGLKTFQASSAGDKPIRKPLLIKGLKQDHTKVEARQNDRDMGFGLPAFISFSRGDSVGFGLHLVAVFFN